jgi:hypothetical protein
MQPYPRRVVPRAPPSTSLDLKLHLNPTAMWGYDYITLSEPQKQARQQALYDVVLCVYISALSLICFAGLFDAWPLKNTSLVRAMKRLGWRLKDPIAVGYPQARCLGDWLLVLGWAMFMVMISMWRTGNGITCFLILL